MEKILLAALVVVFMMVRRASSVYIFQAPSYTLEETYGADNVVDTMIMISRTGPPEETNQQQTITLNTNCRPGVTATASGNDVDITVPATVTFAPGEFEKPVPVTIKTDEEDELRELFCLTIETEPGSEYSTVIIIPGNDFCYDVNLDEATSYGIGRATYVGPWFTDISDEIEIWITPDTTAMAGAGAVLNGGDIQIYLANVADPSDSNMKYYGIFLDDSDASFHGGVADHKSVIIYDIDQLLTDGDFQAILTATDLIDKTTAPNKFWLKYEQSSGSINLGTDTDRVLPLYDWSHGSTDALTVKHIFVSSKEGGKSTYIKICNPASPRKINPVGASSSGSQEGGVANRAKDGERGPGFNDGNCFLSDEATDPWLRIDLGQEYDVKLVLIWPVDITASGLNAGITAASIDDAVVYVGSCDGDFKDNTVCEPDPAVPIAVTTQVVVENSCDAKTYGRYVYLYKDNSGGAASFSLCEIEVYATEIPYGDETTVQFSEWNFDVDEDSGTATIQAIRTGDLLTCTVADFYTDSSTTPVSGNTADFAATSLLTPGTFKWGANDADGAVKELSVDIDNDDVCEPYETFKVYLTNVYGGTIGAQSSATVGINDDDSVTFSLADNAFTVSEGDESLDIDVLRSGTGTMQPGSAEIVFTDMTATSDDYDNEPKPVSFDESSDPDTEQGEVTIKDDERYEPDETFIVSLGRLTPPDTCSMTGQYSSATVTIADDDSQFQWDSQGTISIIEGEEKTIDITRVGTVQRKTVDVDIDEGTAELGDDFSISPSSNGITSVFFPQNENSVSITIETEDDSELENDETFTLTLRDPLYPSGNRVPPYQLTVGIRDNDAAYSWKQPSYRVGESSGLFPVCLVRTGYATDKSIGISTNVISDTADIGTDFTPPTSIDFIGNRLEACADVEIQGDTSVEPLETFTLTILSAQDVVLGANSVATVSITDDDNDVGWSQPQYSFSEGATGTDVIISNTGVSSVSVTLTVTSGTALLNTDFSLDIGSGSSITIPSDEYHIAVRIINDEMDEPTKTFTLTISSASTGTISQATTTIFITDDDQPPTQAPPSGLGEIAIAIIVVAVFVGVIVIIIVVVVFVKVTGGLGSSAAGAAPASALPLSTYPPGYAGNEIGNGYGNGLNGYGYGYGNSFPKQAYSPYSYGPY